PSVGRIDYRRERVWAGQSRFLRRVVTVSGVWHHRCMTEHTFDWSVYLDELRTHTSEWLRARDEELERIKRRAEVEQLGVRAVLDERQQMDLAEDALRGRHNESPKTAKEHRDVA